VIASCCISGPTAMDATGNSGISFGLVMVVSPVIGLLSLVDKGVL